MHRAISLLLLFCLFLLLTVTYAQQKPATSRDRAAGASAKASPKDQATIREALAAAPLEISRTATVKDWNGNTLKQGTGDYTCYPTPPKMKLIGPMCLDKVWEAWRAAWAEKKDFKADAVGIAYMLQGDVGASNTDPYATAATADNHWVHSGPHIMVMPSDAAALNGISDDPHNGGPFVMWKGTSYAHIMVPLGKMTAATPSTAAKPVAPKTQ